MKYWAWGILLAAMACAGCKEKQNEPQEDAPKSLAQLEAERQESVDRGEARLLAQAITHLQAQEPLHERHYEVLLTGVKGCAIKPSGSYIDTECPAFVRFHTARGRFNKTIPRPAAMWATFAQKHLDHPAPAVRVLSIRLLLSIAGEEPAIDQRMAELFKHEASEVVRTVIVRSLWRKVGSSPHVAALMLGATRDTSALVRQNAAVGIASIWARGTEGMEPRIRQMLQDPTEAMEVRSALCEQMGTQANEALLPLALHLHHPARPRPSPA